VPTRAGRGPRILGTNGSGTERTNPCEPNWECRDGRSHAPRHDARNGRWGHRATSAARYYRGGPRVTGAGRSGSARRERG